MFEILKLKKMLLETPYMNVTEVRPFFSKYIGIYKRSMHHKTVEARQYQNEKTLRLLIGDKEIKNLTPEECYTYFMEKRCI